MEPQNSDEKNVDEKTQITTIISIGNESDSSLSISLTPPILSNDVEENVKSANLDKTEMDDDSISEHLGSTSASIENDRSLQEIEIENLTTYDEDEGDVLKISQETKPSSLRSSLESGVEINEDEKEEVKAILDEILNNDQFESTENSLRNEELFDIFANLDLDDKSLTEKMMKSGITQFDLNEKIAGNIQNFEELLSVKEKTIEALTSELDSLKEIVSSNPSTLSFPTSTEYKQITEEFHSKMVEYHKIIEQKDEQIKELSENLQESLESNSSLKNEVEKLKSEIKNFQSKNEIFEESRVFAEVQGFNELFSKLEEGLNLDQGNMLKDVKNAVDEYIQKKMDENETVVNELKKTIGEERELHDKELARLNDLLKNIKYSSSELDELRQEMEAKHQKEMEELRQYFEQKCAELEKSYSEEIFSQHSHKRSSSMSSESDQEIEFRPGPGGDASSTIDSRIQNFQKFTKKDFVNLRKELENLLSTLDEFNVESSSEDTLLKLKKELTRFKVLHLLKTDVDAYKNEIRNKYYAELEILNQDYENKVDLLKVEHEKELRSMRDQYSEEIESLKEVLSRMNKGIGYSSTVQEVHSGDFEINEVIQSYERRLQEQIALARMDIVTALENQIQELASNDDPFKQWPEELLTLRDKFTQKYQQEINNLHEEYQTEIAKLKQDHVKALNGALERGRRRSSKDFDDKTFEEKESFKKQATLLRKLLGELLKYFTQCEDEVNNTIVDELVKQASEKNLTDIEKELNESTESSVRTESSGSNNTNSVKRVHLTPNFKELMNILENSEGNSGDFSSDLRNELESCLEKLKNEANAILTLSMDVGNRKKEVEETDGVGSGGALGSLNRKLIEEVQLRMKMADENNEQKRIIETLEKERSVLEGQVVELIERLNITQSDYEKTQIKITELVESGQREIISEGYGGTKTYTENEKGHALFAFKELQEKARVLLVTSSKTCDSDLMQLLEDLLNVSERIIEEFKNEREDLEQQIDVADKKYKQTTKFLEDQAAEREMERDEYLKRIAAFEEMLKSLDKDRAYFANIKEEVDQLENQLKETKTLLESRENKFKEIELEKNEAVEKIFFLREVIRELETQVKTKSETEADLRTLISELEKIISKSDREESEPQLLPETELRELVRNLESQVETLRLSQELVGNEGTLRQLKDQLVEFENIIERKTKELEEQISVNAGTTCSSPSEDMSVRDIVRSKTPIAMNDCEVPLQQLARLKEKLIRHARAEDTALKRIRDLEMQVFSLKTSNEELQTEKDILKREISDQLCTISSLQIRLDDQRIRAEHIEQQTNSSLEARIYDLQKEITELQETLQTRNATISSQNQLIEELRKKIVEKDKEFDESSEDEILITMQKEIEHLRNQNELLHKRINSGVDIIPNIVENIISDKNSDIETLKSKLETAEKQLNIYNSLNLDKSEILTLKNLRNSGTNLSEALSIIELASPDRIRRIDSSRSETFDEKFHLNRRRNDTIFEGVEEISSIAHEMPLSTSGGRKNSTETSKKVHFLESDEMAKLKSEIEHKNELIREFNERLKSLSQLEVNIEFVQKKLDETQQTLNEVTTKYEEELKKKTEHEQQLQFELVQKKMYGEEREKELQLLKDDALRKDQAYLNLAKENKNLKREKENLQEKLQELHDIEEIISMKNNIINELEEQLQELKDNDETKVSLDLLSKENRDKDEEIGKLHEKIHKLRSTSEDKIKEYEAKIIDVESQLKRLKREVELLQNENAELNEKLNDKIAQKLKLNEDEIFKLRNLSSELKQKLFELQTENSNLRQNEETLNEIISDKNRIIDQFKCDSEELQKNLTMIQAKMTEQGNLVDLSWKLREEQRKNAELFEEIQMLKAQLMGHGILDRDIEEISGKVRQELDYSAEIDSNIINAAEDAESSLSVLRQKCKELEYELEKKKFEYEANQLEDANLIEQLRVQLESATENEIELGKLVEKWRKTSEKLEVEVVNLKAQIDRTESTEYKNLPTKESKKLDELRRQISSLKDELNSAQNETLALKKCKRELEINLKYTNDLLEVKKREVEVFEKNARDENVKINQQLHTKVKEVENCRILIDEMETEIRELRKKISEIGSRSFKVPNKSTADHLMNKIEEINSTVKNDKRAMDLILKMTNENKVLRNRILELENENTINVPFENPMNRANYLFAKCLRVESYRKALIFQKKYLISILGSYQVTTDLAPTDKLLQSQKRIRFNGIRKFRCVAYSIIALSRMKFLVRRWNSGAKIADNVNSRYNRQQFQMSPRQFHPITSINIDQSTNDSVPWSGRTPPSKEKSRTNQRISSNVALLKAPQLLSQYAERYGKIQENLEMLLNEKYNPPI